MYRPEIKVFDCTIRDGGLMNNWRFSKGMVREVFDGLARAGVDYAELGYRADKRQFDPKESGPWRFSDEADLREVAYECGTKVSVMCDVGRTDYDTVLPSSESIVRMYRVATYAKDVDKAIHLGRHAKAAGYEVCVNVMAVSNVVEPLIDEVLDQLAETDFEAVYLVDSFGYFYSEQIHFLADKYLSRLKGKEVGIHCHNNQQLAFANTVEGVIRGVNWLDASIYGMGRAAGNCTTELLLGFLKNPRYDLRPLLELIEKYFIDLHRELKWGYEIPYMINGVLNAHPKSSLEYMKELADGKVPKRSLVDFYNAHFESEVID